jgi:outer membrane murein-binding lipoprotein Lpp
VSTNDLPWRVTHSLLYGNCIETADGSTVAMSLAKSDADLIVAAVNNIPRTHHLATIVDRLAVQVAELEAEVKRLRAQLAACLACSGK